jgi:hypothetical protein
MSGEAVGENDGSTVEVEPSWVYCSDDRHLLYGLLNGSDDEMDGGRHTHRGEITIGPLSESAITANVAHCRLAHERARVDSG